MNTEKTVAKTFSVKPYLSGELAKIYGVSMGTFRRWLKPYAAEIGIKQGHYFSVKQVEIIIDKLGLPSTVEL